MSEKVDIKELLAAGAHFGHKTSRWSPKMAPYIWGKRNGAHIINLEKTVEGLDKALPELEKIAASGKKILFVGTKKQIRESVKTAAEEAGMPYMVNRWVGGTLTNVETVNRQIRKLKNLEKRLASGELEARYSKLEVQRFEEEIELLNERYGGIKEMTTRPAALIVVDCVTDKNAIKEAKTLGIPVFAVVDTNVDPTPIDYVIPGNDDSIKATELFLSYFVDAIKTGAKKAPVAVEKAGAISKTAKSAPKSEKTA